MIMGGGKEKDKTVGTSVSTSSTISMFPSCETDKDEDEGDTP